MFIGKHLNHTDKQFVHIDRDNTARSELGRRDRPDATAGADVENRASWSNSLL
jgi:hypothetical protein